MVIAVKMACLDHRGTKSLVHLRKTGEMVIRRSTARNADVPDPIPEQTLDDFAIQWKCQSRLSYSPIVTAK